MKKTEKNNPEEAKKISDDARKYFSAMGKKGQDEFRKRVGEEAYRLSKLKASKVSKDVRKKRKQLSTGKKD